MPNKKIIAVGKITSAKKVLTIAPPPSIIGDITIAAYVLRHKEWSLRTFGGEKRTKGIIKHIRMKLEEIEETPDNNEKAKKAVNVIILAFDLLWRLGLYPDEIEALLIEKQKINMERRWPKDTPPDKPSLHIKE